MKGIVVYYSGGGNTKKIANAIHRGMQQVIEVDVASVKDVDPRDMGDYDLIGVGTPIWFYRETANVRLFVYNMPDMTGKQGFVFCTHGGGPSGFNTLVLSLQRKGLSFIGWNNWRGASYYTLHMPPPMGIEIHPDATDKLEAEEWGREIAERALRIYAGEKDLIPVIPRPSENPLFQPHGRMQFFPGSPVPQRKINMGKCRYPECTLCVDNCDAHSIDFSVTPPVFKTTCLNCCLCDRMCPQGAIEIDEAELRLIRPMKRIDITKCKYPACTLCVDYCSMDAIDFSVNPPVFKQSCEGDDLCWVICPQGAIEITNNDVTHRATADSLYGPDAPDSHFKKDVWRVEKYSLIMDMENLPRYNINELMKDDN